MTIKQFIEKAVEGGYLKRPDLVVSVDRTGYTRKNTEGNETFMPIDSILLDPLAWQAVGKVEGWDNYCSCKKGECTAYIGIMHRMIDALAEGKSISDFLKEL